MKQIDFYLTLSHNSFLR